LFGAFAPAELGRLKAIWFRAAFPIPVPLPRLLLAAIWFRAAFEVPVLLAAIWFRAAFEVPGPLPRFDAVAVFDVLADPPREPLELGAFETFWPVEPLGFVARVLFGCWGPPSLIEAYLLDAFCAWEELLRFCADAVCWRLPLLFGAFALVELGRLDDVWFRAAFDGPLPLPRLLLAAEAAWPLLEEAACAK